FGHNAVLSQAEKIINLIKTGKISHIFLDHRVQLCRNCLRITVGTPEENDALMEAMHAFVRL
ncbi:MAG: hypothetical protein IKJ42_09460, partial [Bacteroidaceae bacterium]|nr:hypothetical protein [Bacteroidaceae bacterium]